MGADDHRVADHPILDASEGATVGAHDVDGVALGGVEFLDPQTTPLFDPVLFTAGLNNRVHPSTLRENSCIRGVPRLTDVGKPGILVTYPPRVNHWWTVLPRPRRACGPAKAGWRKARLSR